ncbi:MAG TPA: hypothetical protein PKD83_07670 [Ignavibacteria bacterium]|nr:hypothetical protein [Ignavibacteria bacterium]
MRGINYLAGLGTIFIFIGIFCFKALFPKQMLRENKERVDYTTVSVKGKVLLILFGIISIIIGTLLILRALKVI